MRSLITLALLGLAAPAVAQDGPPSDVPNSLTIGGGIATVPRYEGSNDNTLVPAVAARGSYNGYTFAIIGATLYTDLVPMTKATGAKFVLGPVAHVTFNRTSRKRTHDARINALGKQDLAVELGGQVGFQQTGVITSDYDVLAVNLSYVHDVTGTHDSYILTPGASYSTPLSKSVLVGLSTWADYVGGDYSRNYFGVTPAQRAASGLSVYTPGKGWKDINFSALGALSLSGDLRRGLAVVAVGTYTRLIDDIGRSPVVRDRKQLIGSVGLAYTF